MKTTQLDGDALDFQIEKLTETRRKLIRLRMLKEDIASLRKGKEFHVNGDATILAALDSVSLVFRRSRQQILSRSRTEDIVLPRMTVYYVASEVAPELSSTKIGETLKRDHGSILHGIRAVKNRMDTDHNFAAKVLECLTMTRTALKRPTK